MFSRQWLSRQRFSKQQGLTLIELMVSMLIGLFIITMVSQVFLSTNRSNRLNHQLGLMQEAARTATSLIARDVRMAGYTGCDSATVIGNALASNAPTNEWATSEHLVQGLNQTDSATRLDPQTTSESLLIFKLDPNQTFTITNHNTNTSTLTLDSNVNDTFAEGDAVGITRQDCSQVGLVALTSVNGNNVVHGAVSTGDFRNCHTQVKGDFRCYDSTTTTGAETFDPGYLKPLKSVAFYIKPENGLPTLFRKEVGQPNPVAMVDGIERLRIYYGLDSDGNGSANRYVQAGGRSFRHADWRSVSSIRIHLIARSEIEVTPAPRDYFFDGKTVTPSDRFLRKEYVLTLALRNQG